MKVVTLGLCLLVLACERSRYEQPITLTPHGDAVRANMKAQIIRARPAKGVITADSARAVLALERYRAGETSEPEEQSTSSLE